MNKVILVGRLTKDPEIRYSQGAEPVCIARFTLAVNKRFKKEGEPDADFITCVAFRKTAETMEKFFRKGMQLSLSGSISVRTYEDKDGQRRWITEVNADEINFTESKAAFAARSENGQGDSNGNVAASPVNSFGTSMAIDEDEDLPF